MGLFGPSRANRKHVNRHGPKTAACGFAAHVGGLVIFTLEPLITSHSLGDPFYVI
jgi:hypothetical protein